MAIIQQNQEIYYIDYQRAGITSRHLHNKGGRKHYYKADIPGCSTHVAFLPLRSNLTHKYGRKTIRTSEGFGGVDYHVPVIVEIACLENIVTSPAIISNSELTEIRKSQKQIQLGFERCIDHVARALARERMGIKLNTTEENLIAYTTLIHYSAIIKLEDKIVAWQDKIPASE